MAQGAAGTPCRAPPERAAPGRAGRPQYQREGGQRAQYEVSVRGRRKRPFNCPRSYWIPGSYASVLSEKRNSFLRLLKNKGFKEERMAKVGVYAIGSSTTLESNKSLIQTPDSTAHERTQHGCGLLIKRLA